MPVATGPRTAAATPPRSSAPARTALGCWSWVASTATAPTPTRSTSTSSRRSDGAGRALREPRRLDPAMPPLLSAAVASGACGSSEAACGKICCQRWLHPPTLPPPPPLTRRRRGLRRAPPCSCSTMCTCSTHRPRLLSGTRRTQRALGRRRGAGTRPTCWATNSASSSLVATAAATAAATRPKPAAAAAAPAAAAAAAAAGCSTMFGSSPLQRGGDPWPPPACRRRRAPCTPPSARATGSLSSAVSCTALAPPPRPHRTRRLLRTPRRLWG